jgi:serine/threonine-protein kinase
MADASADHRVGEVLEGRYRIIERIASGGMGVVYRAERVGLGRYVAIKFLSAAGATDEQSIQRFEREARAMSLLSHPHVVSVMDFGVAGTPYIVMDYVTGRPLNDLIDTGPLAALRAVHIIRQVTAGLAHAHGHGIIHRDVKPANVMLTEATGTGDFVRILDFGLAKLRGGANLSSTNIVVGTPSYMAPEQTRGKETDGRADVYASGVLLFELLTGDKPFIGGDTFETLRMHQRDPVPPLGAVAGNPELSVALEGVVHRAMAKEPEDRFQTALEMGDALKAIATDHQRKHARPRGKARATDLGRAETLPSLVARIEPEPEPTRDPPEPTPAPPEPTEVTDEASPLPPRRDSSAGTLFLLLILIAGGGAGWYWWKEQQAMRGQEAARSAASGTEGTAGEGILAVGDAGAAILVPDGAAALAIDAAAAPADAAVLDAPIEVEELEDWVILDDAGVPVPDAATAPAAPDPGAAIDAGITALDPAAAPPAPPKPKPIVVRRAADAKALMARGDIAAAAAGLNQLIRKHPKNAYYHLLLAHLNYDRGWRSEALKGYGTAARLKPLYRRYRSINDNAINSLASSKTRGRATFLITRVLKRSALPFLRRAAKSHRSPSVRQRAAALIKRIR